AARIRTCSRPAPRAALPVADARTDGDSCIGSPRRRLPAAESPSLLQPFGCKDPLTRGNFLLFGTRREPTALLFTSGTEPNTGLRTSASGGAAASCPPGKAAA